MVSSMPHENLHYPYRRHYRNHNGVPVEFEYIRRIYVDKLLFLCRNTASESLCVKFTKKYSATAHRHCAASGVAPEVHAVEDPPGGWIMVVMEYLDDENYQRLRSSDIDRAVLAEDMRRVIDVLHGGGFVHGDIRDVNTMVRRTWRTGEEKVLLVDFDWAGEQGTARYPPNVNRAEIFRPGGAIDGEPITREHDIEMVRHMVGE